MAHKSAVQDVPADGRWHVVRLPVTTDMNGMDVDIHAHVIHKGNGPTLTLLSGLHGNEWLHLDFFMELHTILSDTTFQGRVILIPLANAVAFGSLTRNIQDDSDSPDANRLFPIGGPVNTGLSEQIAYTLAQEIFPETNYLLDFHLGIWGSTLGSTIVGIDYSDMRVNDESRRLSRAFGVPLIYRAHMQSKFPGPRASQPYAGEFLKIPCCGSFLGGAGFDSDLEKTWTQGNIQGVLNVMSELGMQDSPQLLPERYLVYETIHRLNPKMGGLLQPMNERDSFGREVAAGELLGKVV
ncbi:MAG: succinylglutamate desuccinylase/aspartoacylase family protein, partial [Deinococcota bacterium]